MTGRLLLWVGCHPATNLYIAVVVTIALILELVK